ncbi:MAG: site-2 protease family protein [Desulfocapsaceae bacterium]|nr:site-2 protease family protein [Desulfocapsaceae bacterium]
MPSHSLSELILLAPPLLFALTMHEFAHGCVASFFGDPTAKMQGRLTLNPLKHLDPIGTLAFFFISFGWARPVPVNPNYFRNPRKDMLWVALAGPATNIVIAVVSAMAVKLVILAASIVPSTEISLAILKPLAEMLVASVWINLVLCIFNFLPIPPLDGSRILAGVLPEHLARPYAALDRYGFIILILLMYTKTISHLIMPIILFANRLLLS